MGQRRESTLLQPPGRTRASHVSALATLPLAGAAVVQSALVWRIDQPNDPPAIATHGTFVQQARLSPDGSRLVTVANDFVGLWSIIADLKT